MTKLGAHVVQGSRNGYGQYCTAKPAVVLSVGDGGALTEARQKSGGHTYTIYRHVLYKDAPHGIDQTTPDGARAMADYWYPQLRAKWQQNPADFYTTINEPGGHDLTVIPNYAAFELRMIELAAADGYKLCVLNLAWGTPDDGNVAGGQPNGGIETWKQYYVPVIREAFRHGMIYGRHGYGQLDDPSSQRPFQEAAYLRGIGLNGGIVITELGINAGDVFPGTPEFMAMSTRMDAEMRKHSNIIGGCLWTLGEWQRANWQDAIPAMTAYLSANPTPKWTPDDTPPPQPPTGYKSVVYKLAQEHTADEWAGIARLAYTESKRTMTASGDNCLVMVRDGNTEESYAVIFDPSLPSQVATIQQFTAAGIRYQTRVYRDTTPPPTIPAGVDMARYFLPKSGNFGQILILKNSWGAGDERCQLQADGTAISYVTKNSQYERRTIDATHISLTLDTSPGNGEYYTVSGAWLPRKMSPGETFTRRETIMFRYKSNCQPVPGKPPYTTTSSIKFDKHHGTWTCPESGIVLPDVVELSWFAGGRVDERYWFAAGLGLVRWEKYSGQRSWIHELVPVGSQGNNTRESGCWS